MTFTLKTRPPTGAVPWPLILVEGGEKSGKSWAAAVLSASPRVGATYWIDLGEGAGDEYGAIPGVRYQVVKHDGTWPQIIGAVEAIREEARRAAVAGELPVVLVLDSMTLIWDMLKDWVTNRARETKSNKKLLADDPNAEINITSNFWNDANARHRKLMTNLMTFPGIAIITARGKTVTAMKNGQPDPYAPKEYRVEGQKDIAFDASVWVRLSRTEHPIIVGARSVHAGIKPGDDKPMRKPGLTFETLIWDILKCNPSAAMVRDLVPLKPGNAGPDGEPAVSTTAASTPAVSARARELMSEVTAAGTKDALTVAWRAIASALKAEEISGEEKDRIVAVWHERKAAVATIDERQRAHLHVLWGQAGYGDDREGRLEYTAEVVGRPVTSWNELTGVEHGLMVAKLQAWINSLEPAGASA